MPSGRTHARDSLLLSALAFGVGSKAGLELVEAGAVSLGCLAGILLSPDLDHDSVTISESLLLRSPSWILKGLGVVWRIIWWPYGKLMPHRSFWSHFPVVGTTIRLLWLGAILYPLLKPGLSQLITNHLFWLSVLGLIASDTTHWARDIFW